ncbi:MAG: sulfatase-like hydrolase/transferase, partial [Nitrososphaeraceae archaeon]
MKFFESLGEYKSKFVVVLFCSTIVGFIFGILKGVAFVGAHRFLEHKMYYLTLYWLSSITSQYLLIALGVGISALIVLMATQAFLKSVSTNVKLNNLIVVGVVPSLLMFIVGGYWINKLYLPRLLSIRSIIGNAVWVLACVITGWLILKVSRTRFLTSRIYNLKIFLTIMFLVVGLNAGSYFYFLSLDSGRPNLILISIDTLRADHLSCYGYHRNTSPNIDSFAKNGVLFSNTIAQSSWTLPSHM